MSDRDPITEAHRQWVEHGWTDAADGMALMTSVVRAQQLVHERVEATLRPHGLTFARYEVLRLLAFSRRRFMPMSQLGSLLQVHATSVTSAVDRLEKQGLVERLRRESDRRVVLASLTSAGEGLVERATADLNAEVFSSPGLAADDVAAASAKAGSKAIGVVIDDAAVTPQYVQGIKPNRELPIIWRITKGSLRNKLVFILPALLLLDEPLSALDPRYASDIMARLVELSRPGTGRAIVVVMHDLAMAVRHADWVICLKAGRLFRSGLPSETLTGAGLSALFDTPIHVEHLRGRPVVIID